MAINYRLKVLIRKGIERNDLILYWIETQKYQSEINLFGEYAKSPTVEIKFKPQRRSAEKHPQLTDTLLQESFRIHPLNAALQSN